MVNTFQTWRKEETDALKKGIKAVEDEGFTKAQYLKMQIGKEDIQFPDESCQSKNAKKGRKNKN